MKDTPAQTMHKTRAAVLLPPSPDAEKRAADAFKLAAAKHDLTFAEMLLMAVCECALRADVDHLAAVCAQTRLSDDQIQLHATEIGAAKSLRPSMVQNVRRFVQFFRTLAILNIVEFQETIENRTVLAHKNIRILHKHQWTSAIHFACDAFEYFGSKVTVYERLLDFGYAPLRHRPHTGDKSRPPAPKTATEKKISMLLHNPHWVFHQDRLERNVKRYTNAHAKIYVHPLNALAAVALRDLQC
jgi:hypothetical protein